MKLPKFFGLLKKPRLLVVRRVVGSSMAPLLRDGQVVVGRPVRRVRAGEVVIVRHDGIEKIKRLTLTTKDHLYVLGDNLSASTDSRHFGWLPADALVARIIWPRINQKLEDNTVA